MSNRLLLAEVRVTFERIEQWLPIDGFLAYEISDYGRIRRVKQAQGAKGLRILKPYLGKVGYYVVQLGTGSAKTRKPNYVHRLVAAAFIGPVEGMIINHKDFDKKNNNVSNLEIVTQADNVRHTAANLRHAYGTANGHAKLTEAQVLKIRDLQGTATTRALAKQFDVTCGIISMIHTRRIWKHVA